MLGERATDVQTKRIATMRTRTVNTEVICQRAGLASKLDVQRKRGRRQHSALVRRTTGQLEGIPVRSSRATCEVHSAHQL